MVKNETVCSICKKWQILENGQKSTYIEVCKRNGERVEGKW